MTDNNPHPSPADCEAYVLQAYTILGPCTMREVHTYLENLRKNGSLHWCAGQRVSELTRKLVRDGKLRDCGNEEYEWIKPKPITQQKLF